MRPESARPGLARIAPVSLDINLTYYIHLTPYPK